MAQHVRPIANRILVEPKELEDKMKSGIYVGNAIPLQYYIGTVLAIGTKVTLVAKGETIAFLKYGYDEIEVGDKKMFLVEESAVIAAYDDK